MRTACTILGQLPHGVIIDPLRSVPDARRARQLSQKLIDQLLSAVGSPPPQLPAGAVSLRIVECKRVDGSLTPAAVCEFDADLPLATAYATKLLCARDAANGHVRTRRAQIA